MGLMSVLTDGLHDHGVHLIRTKLELVPGETVRQAKCHCVHLRFRQSWKKS